MTPRRKTPTPTPPAVYTRPHRLRTVFDCNRLLAKLINKCIVGEMDEGRAARIGYLIGLLMRGLELGDIEARLRKLEEMAGPDTR